LSGVADACTIEAGKRRRPASSWLSATNDLLQL
jgi:hypothetical protein